jgi:hypothetical protein
MDWLEQNIDAYRIIAEILNELREIFRERLEAMHGKTWYKTGLPEGLLDRLIASKEQEKAIDWYESEYQQIITYAVFPDLLEILEHNAEFFPQIKELAPTPALLHARFLELEVMRAKLGRARPISETELSFLGTFHLRYRKAVEELRAHEPATVAPAPRPTAVPASDAPPAAVNPTDAAEPESEAPSPQPVPPTEEAPPAATEEITEAPRREAQTAEPAPSATPPDGEPETEEKHSTPAKEPGFEEAIEAGASQVILRELYREVTAIAEGIWTKEVLPQAKAWDKVCVSSWYENNFSELGLRPLSDFYEIISKVDGRMRSGISKEELQGFLKDANFAQVLLALRDMFQRNHI